MGGNSLGFFSGLMLLAISSLVSARTVPVGFVDLQQQLPGVQLDIRYFSDDNFVGSRVDGYLAAKCLLSIPAAKALLNAQQALRDFGLGLKVFDCYRPQSAVDHFVRWAKDLGDTTMKKEYYPEVDKEKLFSQGYIAEKSGHSRGSTLDLTLISLSQGTELDMGTKWDFFSPFSWPSSLDVTAQQRANRLLLQRIMLDNGFKPLKEEWWHFTLKQEPFPECYFDFPVE